MANYGGKLPDLTATAVTERLREESDGKAVRGLVVARGYLDGYSPATISMKYGWLEQTIYSWFNRIETQGLEDEPDQVEAVSNTFV